MNEHEAIKNTYKGAVLDIEPVNGKTEEDLLRDQIALLKKQKEEAEQVVRELEDELSQKADRFQDLLDAVRLVLNEAEVEPGEPVFHYAKRR